MLGWVVSRGEGFRLGRKLDVLLRVEWCEVCLYGFFSKFLKLIIKLFVILFFLVLFFGITGIESVSWEFFVVSGL